jgi:hypothetical protein
METSLFVLVSDDHGHLEIDGRLDLLGAFLSTLSLECGSHRREFLNEDKLSSHVQDEENQDNQ